MRTKTLLIASLSLLTLVAGAGCGTRKVELPAVAGQNTQPGPDRPSAQGGVVNTVKGDITFNKSVIIGETKEFIYGTSLQYSAVRDEGFDLTLQSIVMGNIPVKFRIQGDELQLVSDNKRISPSDINHPERVVTRFKILAQTQDTLTVSHMDSRITLADMFGATTQDSGGALTLPSPAPKDLWVRSFEFVNEGNYILQETSVMLANGGLAEFMESVYPRTHLTPGKGFRSVRLDPKDPTGAPEALDKENKNPHYGRLRYIPGEKQFDGEKEIQMASFPDLSEGRTMDWYVTSNCPDEYLPLIKAGIEGWNRYFLKLKGFEREALIFKGKLPAGIKIGDPRYNVVNWDSVTQAGAAYESQGTDPATGKQSHSLIYMPAAWLQIGTDYWKEGQDSGAPGAPKAHTRMGARAACMKDISDALRFAASGKSEISIEDFSKELFKGVLLHEVGHALGMAHNFKGSLSYVPGSTANVSTSAMDYTVFELGQNFFESIDSANGPILEYDRQFISIVFNDAKDIDDKTPNVAACNDEEADKLEGGVDPLCIRYDAERDPSLSIERAFKRINEPKIDGDVTLLDALERSILRGTKDVNFAAPKTEAEFFKTARGLTTAMAAPLKYYLTYGRTGVSRPVRVNLKTLYQIDPAYIPQSTDEYKYNLGEMRGRVLKGVIDATDFTQFPAHINKRIEDELGKQIAALKTSPYYVSVQNGGDAKALAELDAKIKTSLTDWLANAHMQSGWGAGALRAEIYGALARKEEVDFYLGAASQSKEDKDTQDYEKSVIQILVKGAMQPTLAEQAANTRARVAAVKSLMTFKGRAAAKGAIESVLAQVEIERASAATMETRRVLESLYKTLSGAK